MGHAASKFKQTDVVRAVKAARAAGLDVARVEIKPIGEIVIHHQTAPEEPTNAFDQWQSKHARASQKPQ